MAVIVTTTGLATSNVLTQSTQPQLPGATAPSAETLLKDALRASATGTKAVFVVFGASWCPPCWKLDAFLNAPDTSKVLSRHYELLHLTMWENNEKAMLNNAGADQLFSKWGGRDAIPFVAFIDKTGRPLASGNLDAPDQSGVRQELMSLFERTAPEMSADERAMLRIGLRNGLSAIGGRVIDDVGRPVAAAEVSLVAGSHSVNGQWTPVWGPRTQTDEAGRYVFEDVSPGQYRLLAVADARTGFATLDVAPRREENGIDVRLMPIPRATVSGAVTGPDGKAIASGSVTLTSLDRPADSHGAPIGVDGVFTVRQVLPGRYNLWVRSTRSPGSIALGGMQPLLVTTADAVNVMVMANKGARLSGRVLFEGGSPSAAERAAIRITAEAMPPQPGAPPAIATMSVAGQFQIGDVFGSRVIRLTHLPPGWELVAVRLNSEDITNKPVHFTGVGSLSGITVTVSCGTCRGSER